MIRTLVYFLLATPLAAQTIPHPSVPHLATSSWVAQRPPNALSRQDIRVSVGVGSPIDGGGVAINSMATMTVESRFLGPFSAQLGGMYGMVSTEDLETAAFTAGLGLARGSEGIRTWVMANVWSQSLERHTSPAASLSAGFQTGIGGRVGTYEVGVYGEAYMFLSDMRAPEAPAGLLAMGHVGVTLTI